MLRDLNLRLFPHFLLLVRDNRHKIEKYILQLCSLKCHLFSVISFFLLLWTNFNCVPYVIALLWLLPEEAEPQQFSKNSSTSSFLFRDKPFPEDNMDVFSHLYAQLLWGSSRIGSHPNALLLLFFNSYRTFDLQLLRQTVVVIIVVS